MSEVIKNDKEDRVRKNYVIKILSFSTFASEWNFKKIPFGILYEQREGNNL